MLKNRQAEWITVYYPFTDPKNTLWFFRHGEEIILCDLSLTDIPIESLHRGGAQITDTYQVLMDKIKDGATKIYKVTEVLKYKVGE